MTIQDAYKYAVSLPIKDMPGIEIVCGETKLFLKEVENNSIELCDADSLGDDGYHFCIKTSDLLSDKWEVVVVK